MSVLPDEVLAHRLAMIPIPTNLEEPLYAPDECPNCKDVIERDRGCPMCQVLYTLSARGPSADSEEEYKTVYAGDITTISDPFYDIRDEHKSIPLTVLAKGQFLEFYAFAVVVMARDHAKWSPVAAVGFRPHRITVLNKPKKASVLFDLGLTTSDGTAIDAKLFGKDKKLTDINHVMDLRRPFTKWARGPVVKRLLMMPSPSNPSRMPTCSPTKPTVASTRLRPSTWPLTNSRTDSTT